MSTVGSFDSDSELHRSSAYADQWVIQRWIHAKEVESVARTMQPQHQLRNNSFGLQDGNFVEVSLPFSTHGPSGARNFQSSAFRCGWYHVYRILRRVLTWSCYWMDLDPRIPGWQARGAIPLLSDCVSPRAFTFLRANPPLDHTPYISKHSELSGDTTQEH